MAEVFLFGNSHVVCNQKALAAGGQPNGIAIRTGNLNDYNDRIGEPGLGGVPGIVQRLHDASGLSDVPRLWVSRIGGSEHVAIGWIEGERPFDFLLPGLDDDTLAESAEFVPFSLIREVLERRVRGSLEHLGRIRAICPVPMIHLESPPPISDTDYAQSHLDAWFARAGKMPRVAPARLRWKLWKLQTRLSRRVCAEAGVAYVASPPEVFDGQGYLARRFWSNDATHGNAEYGALWNAYLADNLNDLAGLKP